MGPFNKITFPDLEREVRAFTSSELSSAHMRELFDLCSIQYKPTKYFLIWYPCASVGDCTYNSYFSNEIGVGNLGPNFQILKQIQPHYEFILEQRSSAAYKFFILGVSSPTELEFFPHICLTPNLAEQLSTEVSPTVDLFLTIPMIMVEKEKGTFSIGLLFLFNYYQRQKA